MSSQNTGAFIPTTNVWDVSEIYQTDVTSDAFKELLVRLYQNLNLMSIGVNARDAGIYDTSEFVCGQVYFPDPALRSSSTTTPTQRPVYRKVINFGALPAVGGVPKQVAHGITITDTLIFTRIYGTAKRTTISYSSVPLPNPGSSVMGAIRLEVREDDVYITTLGDNSAWNAYVTLEYLK